MSKFTLFTDASADSKSMIGFGAYLIIKESDLNTIAAEEINKRVKVKMFESTSSTKLEIETLLWAVEELKENFNMKNLFSNLDVYTDSQCIAGLPGRRLKLESSDFISKSKNKELSNMMLYRKFYQINDELKFEVIKVSGHSRAFGKNNIELIFSCLDRASRKALRMFIKK